MRFERSGAYIIGVTSPGEKSKTVCYSRLSLGRNKQKNKLKPHSGSGRRLARYIVSRHTIDKALDKSERRS